MNYLFLVTEPEKTEDMETETKEQQESKDTSDTKESESNDVNPTETTAKKPGTGMYGSHGSLKTGKVLEFEKKFKVLKSP